MTGNIQKTPRQHLIDLATWSLENRCCSTADTIRELLLSLYNGDNKCDLSKVHNLDARRRQALAAVLVGIGTSTANLWDYDVRNTFAVVGGEQGLRWFLAPLHGIDDKIIRHFMAGVQRKAVAA